MLDGAVNGDHFTAFAQTMLAPVLKPGDVVAIDNLSSHKRTNAQKIERNVSLVA